MVQHSQRAITRVTSDGTILLRFSNYYTVPPAEQSPRGEHDEETTGEAANELALPVIEMIEEEFTNPFACSTSEARRILEFNLRVFEEEDLEDDDPDVYYLHLCHQK